MTDKRFTYFQNRLGNWLVEDNIEDKYIIDIPRFIGFNNEVGAKVFCDLLNELHEENQELRQYLGWQDMELQEMEDME